MKIAIVGTTIPLTEDEEKDMRQNISLVLKKHNPHQDVVISGGAKGVDIMALEIAKELGFQTIVYTPEKKEWEYYKKRNLEIAQNCDKLYCFSISVHVTKCYHHYAPQEHEKTAGCWTAGKASEMGKPYELIVISSLRM